MVKAQRVLNYTEIPVLWAICKPDLNMYANFKTVIFTSSRYLALYVPDGFATGVTCEIMVKARRNQAYIPRPHWIFFFHLQDHWFVAVFLLLLVWLGKLLSASEITVRGRTWQWRICPAMGLVSCCVVPHNCAGFLLSCMLWWINCVLHCCICQAAEAWSLWVEGEQHWYLYLSAAQGQCFQHTMVLSFEKLSLLKFRTRLMKNTATFPVKGFLRNLAIVFLGENVECVISFQSTVDLPVFPLVNLPRGGCRSGWVPVVAWQVVVDRHLPVTLSLSGAISSAQHWPCPSGCPTMAFPEKTVIALAQCGAEWAGQIPRSTFVEPLCKLLVVPLFPLAVSIYIEVTQNRMASCYACSDFVMMQLCTAPGISETTCFLSINRGRW